MQSDLGEPFLRASKRIITVGQYLAGCGTYRLPCALHHVKDHAGAFVMPGDVDVRLQTEIVAVSRAN